MGVGRNYVSSNYTKQHYPAVASCNKKHYVDSGNPDPTNFKFLDVKEMGKYIIAKVHYPDAKNFEGNKVLVLQATLLELINTKSLDPHFSEKSSTLNVIARFPPTLEGHVMAVKLCNLLNNEKVGIR